MDSLVDIPISYRKNTRILYYLKSFEQDRSAKYFSGTELPIDI